MEYTIIEVPDLNDSMSRVVLNGKAYLIRFTWNDRGGFWKFGLYDTQSQPIVIGIKIVPRFPMNLFYSSRPSTPCVFSAAKRGVFGVMTKLEHIGRGDFLDGKASFVFCPAEDSD